MRTTLSFLLSPAHRIVIVLFINILRKIVNTSRYVIHLKKNISHISFYSTSQIYGCESFLKPFHTKPFIELLKRSQRDNSVVIYTKIIRLCKYFYNFMMSQITKSF